MTVSPIGPLAAGWSQVTWAIYCSADNNYHFVITNPGGGALTLASQQFAVRFYH